MFIILHLWKFEICSFNYRRVKKLSSEYGRWKICATPAKIASTQIIISEKFATAVLSTISMKIFEFSASLRLVIICFFLSKFSLFWEEKYFILFCSIRFEISVQLKWNSKYFLRLFCCILQIEKNMKSKLFSFLFGQ